MGKVVNLSGVAVMTLKRSICNSCVKDCKARGVMVRCSSFEKIVDEKKERK